ncbi:MAG TPA: cation:proton antiporter [Actinomycetota bacterium]|nr:cation:proton antiporter [Actinomycetota bacterium]
MSTERILAELALMFVAAKVAGAAFEKVGQPAVIGELGVGIVLGAHALGLIGHSVAHEVFQELGAIVLLFAVGLDTPPSHLKAVGGRSAAVGIAGIVVPFAAGFALIMALEGDGLEAAFIGTALVATSVGVTARVLSDLGRVEEPESRVILGAAVVDDILGLLVLAVVSGVAAGSLSVGSVVALAGLAIGFVVLVGGLGPRVILMLTPWLDRLGNQGVFAFAFGLCLVLAAVAGALQLAAIIGAFLAGLALAETRDRYGLEERLTPVYSFLVPFFFVVTGSLVDVGALADPAGGALALGVTAIAVAGKLGGCGAAAWGMGRRSALIVGTGMVPRGEVGILVATIGLSEGIIDAELYTVVVIMSVATTLIVPPALKALFAGRPPAVPGPRTRADIEGIGG